MVLMLIIILMYDIKVCFHLIYKLKMSPSGSPRLFKKNIIHNHQAFDSVKSVLHLSFIIRYFK